MIAVAEQSTVQSVSLDSKEGKAFLRRVVRENDKLSWDEAWSAWGRAEYASDGYARWTLEFTREVKQGIGLPDLRITVVVTDPPIGYTGPLSSGVEDTRTLDQYEKPVFVHRPNRFILHRGDCGAFAELLERGWKCHVVATRGSISSSEFGMSFYYVDMNKNHYRGVTVGGQTVAANGKRIVHGPVDW